MKYRITIQKTFFSGDEIINELNRTESTEIESDTYKQNIDEVIITTENLNYAKLINNQYRIGDVHKSPVKSISFIIDNVEIETFDMLADPYYKLEKFENDEWVIIDKHRC